MENDESDFGNEVGANVKKVLVTRMGYNFCYYLNYLYSSIVYKILFILEVTIYLGKLLSTLEVGDYELLSNMVEMVIVEYMIVDKKGKQASQTAKSFVS